MLESAEQGSGADLIAFVLLGFLLRGVCFAAFVACGTMIPILD